MVEAARKYNRMVQVGMQSRTTRAQDPGHADAARRRHRQGLHGEGPLLQAAQVDRPSARRARSAGVDYNTWLGPAPMRPFNPNRFHYNWHWFWDTGNGDIGNQGVHEMDIARWGLNKNTLPDVRGCRRRKVRLRRRSGNAQHANSPLSNTTIANWCSRCAAC